MASFGDAFGADPDCLESGLRRRRRGDLQEARGQGERLRWRRVRWAASWSATRRRTACCARSSAAAWCCRTIPRSLILPAGRGGAEIGLPDEAQVCSCNNVTKAEIVAAVSEGGGCDSPACVTRCTQAGATCGSCKTVVKKIVEDHFAATGKAVDKSLCEHFRMTRQEALRRGGGAWLPALRRHRRRARHRPGLRHLQAHGGLDPGHPAQPPRPRRQQRDAAGHQRRLPREPAEERHLLGGAAHPGRRDHPGQA
ncbi:(2Fe-2S)-binding protein [Nocardioides convexus]|uniref:(2Fe-2S)-binding protein n=1 Tax=Nocardioides convexus TaxID=2712224 RepID=UPI00241817DB|nr:(2Fe-2S)-binding protein [Nocardioides convexus]